MYSNKIIIILFTLLNFLKESSNSLIKYIFISIIFIKNKQVIKTHYDIILWKNLPILQICEINIKVIAKYEEKL